MSQKEKLRTKHYFKIEGIEFDNIVNTDKSPVANKLNNFNYFKIYYSNVY